MLDFRVASRYAKSLLDLAVDKGVLDEVHKDMVNFTEIVHASRDFLLLLKNPIISHDKKLKVLKEAFSKKYHPLTVAIFELITKKQREAYLPAIAEQFHIQYNIHNGIESARVTTTFTLTDDLRKRFESIVKEMTGKKPELLEAVDKDIIGGFVLKIGDKQIDDSITGKLKELKLKFKNNPYVKAY